MDSRSNERFLRAAAIAAESGAQTESHVQPDRAQASGIKEPRLDRVAQL